MKVYNQTATITAGSYYGGTTGYDSGIFGSINASLDLMNNPLDAVYWYQGTLYFQLDDGCTGNSGWWRIKIGSTYYYRKDATFIASQYYARWLFTGISSNPFSSGQTISFEIDSVRELLAELAITNASNTASYGYVNESSTNISGDVSRLYNFSHSGHHEIRKFYYYVGYGANDVYLSFKKHNIPNAGWTSVCINGHYFRRTDATYSTTSSGGGMTNWSWTDIDSGILTNPTSGAQTTLVEFYSHDEEIERMREDRVIMRHHGRITPATTSVTTDGNTVVKKGFRYELQDFTVNGTMLRGNYNFGPSTYRFGLTNVRLIELTYSSTLNRVELRYLVSQTVYRPEQELDYLRINDTFFYMAEGTQNKSLFSGYFVVTQRWENVTIDPWESLFYSSSSNPIEFEVGKYDDTVYADCYHFIQNQNVSRSVSLDVDYQCLRILTSPSSLLSNSYNLSISGLPSGTDRYEMSGNRGVLLDFRNITYTAPFTISVQQNNRTSTVTVTNDPTQTIGVAGIYREKRLTHLNYISRDTSTGAATYAIESSPTLVRTLRSMNKYQWRNHIIADQNNLLEIEQKIGNYSVGSASIDSAANLNNTLTQAEALGWSNNYTVDVIGDNDGGDITIEWNHSYPTNTGGTITFDSRLEINVIGSNIQHGVAVKSPSGTKRLAPTDRMPRIHSVVTGVSTSSTTVELASPTNLFDDYHCCQVHSNSAWGATINEGTGKVNLIKNAYSSTSYQQFLNDDDFAVLIFKD